MSKEIQVRKLIGSLELTFETFFRFSVFADMYRFLVLRVLHVSQNVLISFPFQELIANLPVAVVCTIVKGCPLTHILCIDVSIRV